MCDSVFTSSCLRQTLLQANELLSCCKKKKKLQTNLLNSLSVRSRHVPVNAASRSLHPGNDCPQQRDGPASPVAPQTQNHRPPSQLEGCPGPRGQDLLLPHCHKVAVAAASFKCVCARVCVQKASMRLTPPLSSFSPSCSSGKRSGTPPHGKEVARTPAWTMSQRWTWGLPPTTRIPPRCVRACVRVSSSPKLLCVSFVQPPCFYLSSLSSLLSNATKKDDYSVCL